MCHPHLNFDRIDQGVFFVVNTGNPYDKASATTIPKFSEYEGNTNISLFLKIIFFFLSSAKPRNCILLLL